MENIGADTVISLAIFVTCHCAWSTDKHEEHPSKLFHKICVLHYILCWLANYVRLLAGKKIADLGLLVFKSILSEKDQGRENVINCWLGKKLIMILLGEIF